MKSEIQTTAGSDCETTESIGTSDPKHPRRWTSFSLRTMLVSFALLAPAFSYVAYYLNQEVPAPIFWDERSGENIKWSTNLGTQTYSNPTVNGNYVFVGSNNGAGYDPNIPPSVDLGVMLCFEKATGKFVWQHSNAKLPIGRVQDWPLQGVTSSASATDDRLWYVSNRGEVVCLDTDGFRDGENDGPYTDEANEQDIDADVIWKFDMIKQLNVFPHNISHCNVEVDDERVYVKTSNGVDQAHMKLPSPNAPSFLVLDRETGNVVWHDNAPGTLIMHGSWGSPRLATIAGTRQILFPGGDGWLYSYVPEGDGKGNPVLLWKFDCNPKTAMFKLGGPASARNNLLTEPAVVEGRVYVTMGQDPEHGEGPSRVWCIEPGRKRGDLSQTLVVRGSKTEVPAFENEYRHCIAENGDYEIPNPESAKVWEYIGDDANANGRIDASELQMNRSLSRVVIANNCAWVTDLGGWLHCIDLETGKPNWTFDHLSSLWTSPAIAGDHLFTLNEDGEVNVFRASADNTAAKPLATIPNLNFQSYYANATIENGVIYFVSRSRLIAVEDPNAGNAFQKMLRE